MDLSLCFKYETRLPSSQVATVKPVVNNQSPKVYMHLHTRLKKYVMEEQRMAEIQKNNYHLLTRMAEIMHKKGPLDNINNYTPKRSLHKFLLKTLKSTPHVRI